MTSFAIRKTKQALEFARRVFSGSIFLLSIAEMAFAQEPVSTVQAVSIDQSTLMIRGKANCVVHIARSSPPADRAQPCTAAFSVDETFWVEQGQMMTPFLSRVVEAGTGRPAPYPTLPLVPAGRMSVTATEELTGNEELVLFSLEERMYEERRLPYFERRVIASSESWVMPAGRAIATIIDKRSGDAIALSAPVTITRGGVTTAKPIRPGSGADILLILERSDNADSGKSEIELTHEGERIPAQFISESADKVIAAWRALPADIYQLTARTDTTFLPPQEIRVSNRRVTTIRSTLQPRPSLDVVITSELESAALPRRSLLIRQPSGKPVTDELEIDSAGPHRFEHLSPEPYTVELRVGEWTLSETIDLSSGQDQIVTFRLDPISVRGTVYDGTEPAPARIRFHERGDRWIDVLADDRGEYDTILWRPQRYLVRVHLENDAAREPWEDTARIVRDVVLDFRIPKTSLTVRVVDRESGRPVEAASVSIRSSWVDDKEGKKSRATMYHSDERGEALLPRLPAGSLEFVVSAEGYAQSPSFTRQVGTDDAVDVVDVFLDPDRETTGLTLLLPNGSPAAGAEVMARAGWSTTAGSDGLVSVPDRLRGTVLIVRHPQAASSARVWDEVARTATSWTLGLPADPLTVTFERRGKVPLRPGYPGRVILWLQGIRLDAHETSFAAWAAPATGAGGLWVGKNLPRSPLRILGAVSIHPSRIESGAYDSLSSELMFPWPPNLRVELVE